MVRNQRTSATRVATLLLVSSMLVAVSACAGSTAKSSTSGTSAGQSHPDGTTANGLPSGVTVTPTKVSTAPAKPSSGCQVAATTAPATGEVNETMTSGGATRTYLRYVPPGVDPTKPLPLIIDIHGLGSNAVQQEAVTQFEVLAAKEHFVVLTPQGLNNRFNTNNVTPNADVTFMSSMLDQVEGAVCIDTARVYSTGYSDGGLMSSVLACQLSDRITAIGVVSGLLHGPDCKPSRPVPLMVFWGKKDQVLPFYGGLGPALLALLTGKPIPPGATVPTAPLPAAHDQGFPPVEQVVSSWASTNQCPSQSVPITVGSDVTQNIYAPCGQGSMIRFYVVADGGHAWPGSQILSKGASGAGGRSIIGFVTMQVDATNLIWSFFKGYALS
jgi:polyhydroxybutyrate depolymerase